MHRRDLLLLLGLSTLAGTTGCRGWSASSRPAELSPQTTPSAGFAADVDLVLTAAPDEVLVLPGVPTRVWRFTGRLIKGPADTLQTIPGSYLGPVIRLRRGQQVRIRFANHLSESSVVHWHGLDVPQSAALTGLKIRSEGPLLPLAQASTDGLRCVQINPFYSEPAGPIIAVSY